MSEFLWDQQISVEHRSPSSPNPTIVKSTPKYIIKSPFGFRQDDIIHSLTIAVAQLIDQVEAQASNLEKTLSMLKGGVSDEKKTEKN